MTRLHFLATTLLISSFSGLAIAEDGPFLDISYDDAIKKAKADEKIVFIDFYTTWCGPCKMLDKSTWKDEKVQTWLSEKSIPLKIDAEKQRDLAKKFKVRGYPTLLFVKSDGTVMDRIVGYRDAESFLKQANATLSGKTTLDVARETFQEGDTKDPMVRAKYADELARAGDHKEALKHYLWCFDHGLEHMPSYSGVRVSFLLGDITRLGADYPPALEALRERRDKAEKTLRDYAAGKPIESAEKKNVLEKLAGQFGGGDDTFQIAGDFGAINRELGESDRTMEFYDELTESDKKENRSIRRALCHLLEDQLIAKRRYKDLVRDGNLLQVASSAAMIKALDNRDDDEDNPRAAQLRQIHQEFFEKRVSLAFEAAVGASETELSDQILDTIFKADRSASVYKAMMNAADRAESKAYISQLRRDAAKNLKGDEAKEVETFADNLLK